MIAALIRVALTQRLMILLITAAIAAAGVFAFKNLPIDAFPDISSPQVQVIIKAPGMSPSEVEQRITFPVEMEMQGIPGQTILRSTTKYALSVVVIDFEDGTATPAATKLRHRDYDTRYCTTQLFLPLGRSRLMLASGILSRI